MQQPPVVWKSLFFEDFEYLDDPRAPPDYEGEARALYATYVRALKGSKDRKGGAADQVYSPRLWPLMRLERALLIRWDELNVGQMLGTRIEHHMIRFICHLIHNFEADPWAQERVWSFYECRRLGRQITNWFGSQNSGKSSCSAAFANAFCVLHPVHTSVTLSNPYKDAGVFQLWTETQGFFDDIKADWGDRLADWTGAIYDPKKKTWSNNPQNTALLMSNTSSKGILRYSEAPGAGTIRLVAMDKVGKTQGGKAKDRRQQAGYFLMFLDEIGAGYATMDFLRTLPNICSNDNFHAFTACNPINPIGQLDGELGRPDAGFESLKIEEDFVWNSGYNSRTYRFDGPHSPAMLIPGGDKRWPWLFNQRRMDRLLRSTKTADSDLYNAQCRAFMQLGSGTRYVLTIPDIRAGMVNEEFEWSSETKWKVAFLDPALSTDGDEAIYTLLEGGTRRYIDGSTSPIVYCAKQTSIPLFTGKVADQEWVRKCAAVRGPGNKDNHTLNQMIPVEEQLAVEAAFLLKLDQCPPAHFGYDDSMRSKVMEAMMWCMGTSTKAVSSVGDPEDIPMYPPTYREDEKGKRHLVTWREDCQKLVSQFWFFGAAVVRSGLFKCHPSSMFALNEATQRLWAYAAGGRKRVVESKKEMKLRYNGKSPDHADSLFGALYIARKLGLLQLRIDLPSATERLTPASRETFIHRQWAKRKPATGLYATGTRH